MRRHSLLALIAVSPLLVPASTEAAPAPTNPPPVVGSWGAHPFEIYAVWEAPGATRIVWQVIGGGWSQDSPEDFVQHGIQLPAHLQALFDGGVSIGVCGYQTTAFPTPEWRMGDLVAFSRQDPADDLDGDGQPDGIGLDKDEVFLFGRSAGAHMCVFNGVMESDPNRRADRVVTIQQPLTLLSLFDPASASSGIAHFGSSVVGQLDPVMAWWGSSGVWPLEVPAAGNTTRFCIVGQNKPFEAPIPTLQDLSVPLPYGALQLPGDSHSAIATSLQNTALVLGGYDSSYVPVHGTGSTSVQEAILCLTAP